MVFMAAAPAATAAHHHPAVAVEHHLTVQVVGGECPGLGQTAAAYPNVVRQLNGTIPSSSTPAEARN
jgi:hypothetical protein